MQGACKRLAFCYIPTSLILRAPLIPLLKASVWSFTADRLVYSSHWSTHTSTGDTSSCTCCGAVLGSPRSPGRSMASAGWSPAAEGSSALEQLCYIEIPNCSLSCDLCYLTLAAASSAVKKNAHLASFAWWIAWSHKADLTAPSVVASIVKWSSEESLVRNIFFGLFLLPVPNHVIVILISLVYLSKGIMTLLYYPFFNVCLRPYFSWCCYASSSLSGLQKCFWRLQFNLPFIQWKAFEALSRLILQIPWAFCHIYSCMHVLLFQIS